MNSEDKQTCTRSRDKGHHNFLVSWNNVCSVLPQETETRQQLNKDDVVSGSTLGFGVWYLFAVASRKIRSKKPCSGED
jgi:hypothetical protein